MIAQIQNLKTWYESLTIESLNLIENYYHEKCYFKDPFHETNSIIELKAIYLKMFLNLKSPRFIITDSFVNQKKVVLFWDFVFTINSKQQLIKGSTLLEFDQAGKITSHIDYWDSVSEMWMKIPILGKMIKLFYKLLF
jgi:hypothetical protein